MSFPTMIRQAYMEMPPVTRAYTTACVLTTMSVQLELLSPFQLYFNPILIWRNLQVCFYLVSDCWRQSLFNVDIDFNSKITFLSITDMENIYNIFIFWNFWIQFLFQYDIYVSILPNARRKFFQRTYCRFCCHVFVWKLLHGCVRIVCEPIVFR